MKNHIYLDCLTSFSCDAPDGKEQKCLRGENTSNGVDDCIDGSDEKFFRNLIKVAVLITYAFHFLRSLDGRL